MCSYFYFLCFLQTPIVLPCSQYYCDRSQASAAECAFQPGAQSPAIFDIHYENITGTSNGTHGIIFNCSDTVHCRGIHLNNVNVVPASGTPLVSHYHSVHGTSVGLTSPITPGQSWSPPAMAPQQWAMFSAEAARCRYVQHKEHVHKGFLTILMARFVMVVGLEHVVLRSQVRRLTSLLVSLQSAFLVAPTRPSIIQSIHYATLCAASTLTSYQTLQLPTKRNISCSRRPLKLFTLISSLMMSAMARFFFNKVLWEWLDENS